MNRVVSLLLGLNNFTILERKTLTANDRNLQYMNIKIDDEIDIEDYSLLIRYKQVDGKIFADVYSIEKDNDIQIPNSILEFPQTLTIEFCYISNKNDNRITIPRKLQLNVIDTYDTIVEPDDVVIGPSVVDIIKEIPKKTEEGKAEIEKSKDEAIEELRKCSDSNVEESKEQIDSFTSQKQDQLDVYTNVKKSQLDEYTTTKNMDIDSHTDEKKNELNAYEKAKEKELDNYVTTVNKPELDKYTKAKEGELNTHTGKKKGELDAYEKSKEKELDNYVTTVNKPKLDTYTNIKKEELNSHTKTKESEIAHVTETKKQEITTHSTSELDKLNQGAKQETDTQVGRVITEGDAQIQRVQSEGATQVGNVTTEGDKQVKRVQSEIEDVTSRLNRVEIDNKKFAGVSDTLLYIQDVGEKQIGEGYIDKVTGEIYICLATTTDTDIKLGKFELATNMENRSRIAKIEEILGIYQPVFNITELSVSRDENMPVTTLLYIQK